MKMNISITGIMALLTVTVSNQLLGGVVVSAFTTTKFGTISTPLSSPSLQRDHSGVSRLHTGDDSKWYGECHRFRSSTGAMRMVRNRGLEIRTEGASPTRKYPSLSNRTLLHHPFRVSCVSANHSSRCMQRLFTLFVPCPRRIPSKRTACTPPTTISTAAATDDAQNLRTTSGRHDPLPESGTRPVPPRRLPLRPRHPHGPLRTIPPVRDPPHYRRDQTRMAG